MNRGGDSGLCAAAGDLTTGEDTSGVLGRNSDDGADRDRRHRCAGCTSRGGGGGVADGCWAGDGLGGGDGRTGSDKRGRGKGCLGPGGAVGDISRAASDDNLCSAVESLGDWWQSRGSAGDGIGSRGTLGDNSRGNYSRGQDGRGGQDCSRARLSDSLASRASGNVSGGNSGGGDVLDRRGRRGSGALRGLSSDEVGLLGDVLGANRHETVIGRADLVAGRTPLGDTTLNVLDVVVVLAVAIAVGVVLALGLGDGNPCCETPLDESVVVADAGRRRWGRSARR